MDVEDDDDDEDYDGCSFCDSFEIPAGIFDSLQAPELRTTLQKREPTVYAMLRVNDSAFSSG